MTTQILIVEDNAMAANIAKNIIQSHVNAAIEIANSGETALALLKHQAFQLIFMDISLGNGMDGAITSHEIRKLEAQYQRQPCFIFALTAHVNDKDKLYYESMGINGVLQKPLSHEKIVTILAEHPEILQHPSTESKPSSLDIPTIATNLFQGDTIQATSLVQDFKDQLNHLIEEIEYQHRTQQHQILINNIQKLLGSAAYVNAQDILKIGNAIVTRHKAHEGFSDQQVQRLLHYCRGYLE